MIGRGEIDAPEDVIFDADDNLYTGNRDGDSFASLRLTTSAGKSSPISAATSRPRLR